MRKALVVVVGGLLLVASAIYVAFPLPSPSQACRTVMRWADSNLDHPMDVEWAAGTLYVADTEHGAIKRFRADGSLISEWRGFERPVDVTVAEDGAVYVADFLADRISKLRPDGTLLARWGRHGGGAGEFDAPSGVAVDGEGSVYVADFYHHRIQRFTSEGEFLVQWGEEGRWGGQLHYPTDVAVSERGEVLVADAYNHRLQRFSSAGEYVGQWGGIGFGIPGQWRGWFRLAKAVTVDSQGNVYVADAFNRRVQKFTSEGDFVGAWVGEAAGQEGLRYPAGVAAAAGGKVYVSDFFGNRLWAFECS